MAQCLFIWNLGYGPIFIEHVVCHVNYEWTAPLNLRKAGNRRHRNPPGGTGPFDHCRDVPKNSPMMRRVGSQRISKQLTTTPHIGDLKPLKMFMEVLSYGRSASLLCSALTFIGKWA